MATIKKRSASRKRGEEKETVTQVGSEEIMTTQNTEEQAAATVEKEQPKETDHLQAIMEMLRQNAEETKKELQKNAAETKKEMKKNLEEMKKNAEETKKKVIKEVTKEMEEQNSKLRTDIREQIEVYQTEVNQHLQEFNDKWDQTQTEIQQVKEDLQVQMIHSEEELRSQITEVRRLNKEEITHNAIQIDENRTEISRVHNIAMSNRVSIDEIKFQEMSQIKDELDLLRTRPMLDAHHTTQELRDTINFKNHKRNPMEFITRLDEYLTRNKVRGWNMIKGMIDEQFKDINDHWWTVTRHELQDYEEFKTAFKSKYWSESTQNIVRDNICNGRFDPNRGTTPTTYFLGKVCMARNLEPKIPEESLITKLAYHYEEGISRARLCGQIKTISAMTALLENYEHEYYYRKDRRNRAPWNQQTSFERNRENQYNSGNNRNNNRGFQRYDNGNRTQNNGGEQPRRSRIDEYNHQQPRNYQNNNSYNQRNNNNTYGNRNNNNNQSYHPRINYIEGRRDYRVRRSSLNDDVGYFERQRPIPINHTRSRSQEDGGTRGIYTMSTPPDERRSPPIRNGEHATTSDQRVSLNETRR